jgi:hypothetical protein
MSWTIDRDLCALAVDKRTGEVYAIDDPVEGYDVSFERKGTGLKTEYLGLQIARRSSDLGNDDWLDYAEQHPIPDLFLFYDYDHIKDQFSGRPEETDQEQTKRSKYAEEEEKSARRRSATRNTSTEVTYDDVAGVSSIEELFDLVESSGKTCRELDRLNGDEEFADIVELVLDCFGLEPPPPPARERNRSERANKPDDSPRSKLAALKERFTKSGRR